MQKHTLLTSDDYEVYVDLIYSRAGKYISGMPHVASLMAQILKQKKLPAQKSIILENDLGRVIGNCYTVQTSEKDLVFYAQPLKSPNHKRYVRHRQPEQTSVLTMILNRDDNGDFEVSDVWHGAYTPPFPGEDDEKSDSHTFWREHAVIADPHTIQQRTITSEWPY